MMHLPILSKNFILKLLLVLWLVFSFGYISWSIFTNVRNKLMTQVYQQGVADTVNQLIEQAENKDCKPLSIFNKEEKKNIELINTACLTKSLSHI